MRVGDVFAQRFVVLRVVTFDGGQGAVYAVEDQKTGKRRALETLPPHLTGTDEARKSFEAEVRAASRVSNPHVVDMLDQGVDEHGVPWIVMELLEGETLHERMKRGAPPPAEAATVFRQLGHGPAAAHDAGVVHPGLKPANIFLARRHRRRQRDGQGARLRHRAPRRPGPVARACVGRRGHARVDGPRCAPRASRAPR